MPFHKIANRLSQTDYRKKKAVVSSLSSVVKRGFTTFSLHKRGFTLIELLVVLAIIALLSGAIIYSTNNTREKGRDSKRKEELKTIASALTLYYADNNQYPPSVQSDPPILDYSSDIDPLGTGWIPDLATYLEKLPKDPLQAGAIESLTQTIKKPIIAAVGFLTGRPTETNNRTAPQVAAATNGPCPENYTTADLPCTIRGDIANGNHDVIRNKKDNNVHKNNKGNGNGRPTCEDPIEAAFKFTLNRGLIHNVHIDEAKIHFNPRLYTDEERNANKSNPNSIRTQFRVEISKDPADIIDGNDWASRQKTNKAVIWDNIGVWDENTKTNFPLNLQSEDIGPALQELIDYYASQGISIHIINVFWENTGTGNCDGRIPDSKDCADDDPPCIPPEIEIIVSEPQAPACTPERLDKFVLDGTATFNATVNATYSWNLPAGLTAVGATNQRTLIVSFTEPGTYPITVSSGALTSNTCNLVVTDPELPGSTPGDITTTNTACNGKNGILCYRVSLDKKHFVLWAQLENINDPQVLLDSSDLTTWGPSATCKEKPPQDSFLNYCQLSPI